MSFSSVEQFGVQRFGEKLAEAPCGSPEIEKSMERFLERAEVVLIVVVTDEPCVTVTRPEFASDKSEDFNAVV